MLVSPPFAVMLVNILLVGDRGIPGALPLSIVVIIFFLSQEGAVGVLFGYKTVGVLLLSVDDLVYPLSDVEIVGDFLRGQLCPKGSSVLAGASSGFSLSLRAVPCG